jgi:hypothetical protein
MSVDPITHMYADYLAQLRDRIVEGCAPARIPMARHLDGVGYWKKAFDRVEGEKKALLDRLHDLEKAKVATTLLSSPPARSPVTRDRKRRREDTPAAKANSRSKRRANPPGASEPPAENDTCPGNDDVLVAGEISSMSKEPMLITSTNLKQPIAQRSYRHSILCVYT